MKHSFKSFCKYLQGKKSVDIWFHSVLINMNNKYDAFGGENVFYNNNGEWLFQILLGDNIIYSSNRIALEFRKYNMSPRESDNYVRVNLSAWFGHQFKNANDRLFSIVDIYYVKKKA